MANSIFAVLFLLITAAAVSGSDLRLLEYWRTVFPDSPMPGAIRQLLRRDKKMTATGISSEAAVKSLGVAVGGSRRHPVLVNVFPFLYQYAATETQIHADRNVSFFFLEKDLHPGAKMNLHFTGSQFDTTLLNRAAASSIPFSTQKLPDILNLLSVDQNSEEAAGLKKTLQACEEPAAGGETAVVCICCLLLPCYAGYEGLCRIPIRKRWSQGKSRSGVPPRYVQLEP